MKHSRSGRQGFTLIELMIVVAIIGILSAIAIPSFMALQLRSRSAEVRSNLAAIRTAAHSYFGEFGSYVTAAINPATNGGSQKQPWGLTPSDSHGFNTMGWTPEGQVYFNYGVNALPGAGGGLNHFVAEAQSDLDLDGVLQTWGYVTAPPGALVATGPGPFGVCGVAGTWDQASGTSSLLNVVGPCGNLIGIRIF